MGPAELPPVGRPRLTRSQIREVVSGGRHRPRRGASPGHYSAALGLFVAVQGRSLDPQSRFRDQRQISRGKFVRLRRATAGFTIRAFDGFGLRGHVPARPAPYASDPVFVHRLALLFRAFFRLHLAVTPLRFATLHLHQVGTALSPGSRRTCSAHSKDPLPGHRGEGRCSRNVF